jgi:hypothetical protein
MNITMKRVVLIISVALMLVMISASAYAATVTYSASAMADQGLTGTRTLKGLATSIGSSKLATIVLSHTSSGNTTTYSMSQSVTLTSNITLKIEKGAVLSIAAGKTLTINGSFEAGLYQVFDCVGTGVVIFGGESDVYPEWWGAKGDGVNSDSLALSLAVNSISSGRIKGNKNSTYYIPTRVDISNKSHFRISDFNILSAGADDIASDATYSVFTIADSSYVWVERSSITDTKGQTAIKIYNSDHIYILENIITDFTYTGISVLGDSNYVWIKSNKISGCKTRTQNLGVGYGVQISVSSAADGRLYPNYIWVEDNYVEDVPNWDGINAHGGTNIRISGNTIKNCLNPIELGVNYFNALSKLEDILVDRNTVSGAESDQGVTTYEQGISVVGNNTSSLAKRIKITNNVVKNTCNYKANKRGGIYVSAADTFDISGNIVENNGARGVALGDHCSHFTIHNNLIKNNDNLGIFLGHSYINTGTVTANTLYDDGLGDYTQTYGIGVGSPRCYNVYEYGNFNLCSSLYSGAEVSFNTEYRTGPILRGVWKRGERVKNLSAASGGPSEYICIARKDTTIKTQAIAGATNINVASTTDMLAGDTAIIELDAGQYHWTYLDAVVDGDTITIHDPIPTGRVSDIGQNVYTSRMAAGANIP